MNRAKELTDEEFVHGIRTDNEAVMNRLYKMHYQMILHFVSNNGGSEDEARDIYQEAFIILYESLHEETFRLTCKIKTYLYSVCRRLWLKRFTHKSKYFGQLNDSEQYILLDEQDNVVEENEIRFSLMEESLQKIGEPCRTILEDYYLHDMNMNQIAEKMGYTNADNAKNQKYKCLMRLKKIAETLQNKIAGE